ncbi:MAG: type II secretion system protein GspK [Cyanobacteriota bacterium]|nr:type II secretion system protein GspK [Cyanobacteriota bacterium]
MAANFGPLLPPMARKHWLDPLARRLLLAAGQIAAEQAGPQTRAAQLQEPSSDSVERELLELKLRQQPGRRLENATEVRLAAELGWRLDVNRATAADWLRLPGISADHVDLLMRLQAGGVQLSGPEDLERLLNLPQAVVASWQPLLQYRWYGSPALAAAQGCVDINHATARQLQALGLTPQRCTRLLRERARQPFSDLADLQQRLQLPAEQIEAWIGKVRFGQGLAGPSLPLARQPMSGQQR